ncbi:MAG: hypothetical protein ABII88_01935 [Candidatus Omnitrophota bacterium]
MFDKSGYMHFLGYLICCGWFILEIFKSGYLIPVFFMYVLSIGLLFRCVYNLLLKVGYNPQREKKELKKNFFYLIIFAGIAFVIILFFIWLFYRFCDLSKIPLTDNLIQIRTYLSQ